LAPSRTLTVLFDTNFLMVPLRFGVDVETEIKTLLEAPVRIVVPRTVIDEVTYLEESSKPSLRQEFLFAKKLAERFETLQNSLLPGESVDDSILRAAVEGGYVVATTDSQLKRKLRAAGIGVVYLRQGNRLGFDGLLP